MEVREKDEETTSSNTNNNDNNNNNISNNNNNDSSNGELLMLEEREDDEEEEAWGTLEELLLVCAVNRHGTNSWDSIADELQKRIKHSSSNNNNNNKSDESEDVDDDVEIPVCCFSSRNCERKYVHLKRRYRFRRYEVRESDENNNNNNDDDDDDKNNEDDDESVENENENVVLRMVDELRKLRVEELKRQVHRHDASIVSLQLKVKRLEEERESKKMKEEGEQGLVSDLRVKEEENDARTGDKPVEPEKPVAAAGDSAENRSCNESNSTNHHHHHQHNHHRHNNKADNDDNNNNSLIIKNNKNNNDESKLKSEPEDSGLVGPDKHKIVIKKKSEPIVAAVERKVSRLSELGGGGGGGEAVSESRRESTKQQSSDVQSSASLSKKKRRRFRGGGDSGDELEAEEVSPANKRINAKSQPLIRFLDTLRSHKHGSVFQRRLPSQNTEKYRNVIRQHMDLETVQSRLDKGNYCDCHPKFYRDLLLIFTNAVLFYRKSSAEHIAARELRKLVIDEVTQKTRKPKVQPSKPDPEPQPLEPVVKKPRSSTTMVVCRRRSNSSMQALSESIKKGDTTNSKNSLGGKGENGCEEKIKPNHQKKVDGIGNNNVNNSSSGSISSKKEKVGEKGSGGGSNDGTLKKLVARERSNLGNGGLRLSSNNGKKVIGKDANKREKLVNVRKDESSEGEGDEGLNKRKANNVDQKQEKGSPIVLKKQGVANFLKRMKQNSPSQEKTKNVDSEGEDESEEKGGRREKPQSANNNAKKAGGSMKKNVKEVEAGATRRSSSRRGETEAAALRRGIGRPPKRKAAMMSGTPDSAKGGRSATKDSGEKLKKKPRR